MYDFSNQTVVVTGAVGNLGQAVAGAFLDAGARLALLDHKTGRLAEAFPRPVALPEHLLLDAAQATDPESMRVTIDRIVERLGRIDVLVNTVGGYRAGTPVHETPLAVLDDMLNRNVRSVFIACQLVVPHMLERNRGKIVNIGARSGLEGRKNTSAYSIAKCGVIRLTQSMAAELKKSGINVNCVLPGVIDTPENRAAMPEADFSHWVTPEAVAGAILFLASESAREIHGVTLPVYGRM